MQISVVLALIGIAVSSCTAFLVAYFHRKQMRQVEEYRRDPSVGLHPPPSRSWVIAKANIDLITGILLPSLLLFLELRKSEPLTRSAVAFIACYVAVILYTIVSHLVVRLARIVMVIGSSLGYARLAMEMMTERIDLLEIEDPEEKARKRNQVGERLKALRKEWELLRVQDDRIEKTWPFR